MDEIRLGDGGRICAARADAETYRVTVTDARLGGGTVYHQEGDDAVRAALPAVDVAETLVMYTSGEYEGTERLAVTTGCTDRDQTSRTVFRNRRPTGSSLRAAEGVMMLHLRAVDDAVPAPGGSRYAPPGRPTTAGTASGATPHPASRTSRRRSGTRPTTPRYPTGRSARRSTTRPWRAGAPPAP